MKIRYWRFLETTRWDGLKVPEGTKYSLCTVSTLTRKSSSQTYICIFFQRTRIILLEILKDRKLWVNVSRNRTHTRNWSFCIKILEETVTDKTEKSLLLQISHLRFNITSVLAMRQGVVLQIVRYSTLQWKNKIKFLQRVNIVKDAILQGQ